MGERANEIERDIEQTRTVLAGNLHELEYKVKDATDWRKQFEKRPFAILGIAFGGGVLLSMMIGGTSHLTRRYREHDKSGERACRRAVRGTEATNAAEVWDRIKQETWDGIKEAVVGLAASKGRAVVRDAVRRMRT